MADIMSKVMTREEQATKDQLCDLLGQNGYKTYAHLFSKFALHLTEDPETIGFMVPDKGIICLNRNLKPEQVSTIIRHEILHQYLNHGKRELARVKQLLGLTDSEANKITIDDAIHELSNIAADYEISNKGYTDYDKKVARGIKLNGQLLKALVTEDDHPDWVDLTYEEMLEKLFDEMKKNPNGKLGQNSKKSVRIGDQGNQAKQEAERLARIAKIKEEQSGKKGSSQSAGSQGKNGENGKSQGNEDNRDKKEDEGTGDGKDSNKQPERRNVGDSVSSSDAKKGGKMAQDIIDKVNEHNESPFDGYDLTDADIKDINAQLAEIRKILDDPDTEKKLDRDHKTAQRMRNDAQKEMELQRYKRNPLNKFITSLNGFIENEIEYNRDKTWKKPDPRYADTDFIRQGKSQNAHSKVPLVQFYYDRSGSWDDARKQEVGKRGVATLQKYVQEGQLKVETYYFDTDVYTSDVGLGGGTAGQPILDHIMKTKPDNVVIITDSDIDDCRTNVEVPGAVWFLFVNGVSSNLQAHLKGKRLTRSYEIVI